MTSRNEFSRKTKFTAYMRANGFCQKCGARLAPGKYRYDHIDPDWFSGCNDLSNCQVICLDCDAPKTAKDQGDIAKSKRIRDKRIGAKTSRNPMPGSRRSRYKKTMSGKVVLRW